MRSECAALFREVQSEICSALERLDGQGQFCADKWSRAESETLYGGGGLTCVISNGKIIEKGAVNFSEVEGRLPADMTAKLLGIEGEAPFYATGVSLIIHPHSPLVPTTHANFRYLEAENSSWFGGGADLTPYYLFEEDAIHFHRVLKESCDRHDPEFYSRFKKWCDEYFFLPHRGEARGVGGVFYDYLGKGEAERMSTLFKFQHDIAHSFNECYGPIVERRKEAEWSAEQKEFQLIRRGRYVEFNLLYDRGTQFGLKTGGRTESILVSLPAEVRWRYNYNPSPGSEEERLIEALKVPREWISDEA